MDCHYPFLNSAGGGAIDPTTMKAFMDGPLMQWVSKSLFEGIFLDVKMFMNLMLYRT